MIRRWFHALAAEAPASGNPLWQGLYSLALDGVDERVDAPSGVGAMSAVTDRISLCGWFKSTNVSATKEMLVHRNQTNFRGWEVRTQSGEIRVVFYDSTSTGKAAHVATVGSGIANNTWFHLVVTKDNTAAASGITVYINGSAVTLSTVADTLSGSLASGSVLGIGDYGGGGPPGSRFAGNMSNLGIVVGTTWDSSQAAATYGSGSAKDLTTTGLTFDAYYELGADGDDETSGAGTMQDLSGNSADATPYNTESGDLVADVP